VNGNLYVLLSHFFARFGYWVIFIGVMLENGGLPVPGETVLLFAGFLAYHGDIELRRAILTAIAGATLGDSLGFCLGRFGGTRFLEKYRRRFFVSERRFARAQAIFLRHADWAVFIARFVTGLRVFSGILAGVFRMPYPRFLFFNFAGAITWATVIGWVGLFFGSNWERLVRLAKQFSEVTLAVLVLGALIAFMLYRARKREKGKGMKGQS